jgi:hypothetical protein
MKKLEKSRKKCPMAYYRPQYSPGGVVASEIALNPLRRLMRLVTYRRTNRASETADKYGTFLSFFYGIRTRHPSGAIRSEYLPDRGVQWLRVKPWTPSIVRYRRCRASA